MINHVHGFISAGKIKRVLKSKTKWTTLVKEFLGRKKASVVVARGLSSCEEVGRNDARIDGTAHRITESCNERFITSLDLDCA